MKKFLLFISVMFLFVLTAVCQNVETVVNKSFWLSLLSNEDVLNVALPILAFLFAGVFTWLITKLRAAGKLLMCFADAIEDKKVDANERKDLAQKARELFYRVPTVKTRGDGPGDEPEGPDLPPKK